MLPLLAAAAVVMGGLLSVQPLLNAKVGIAAGHPVYAAMFSVLVSSATMILAALVLRLQAPDVPAIFRLPPWALVGGVIGAFVVLVALTATPRLGAATTVALFIAGQLVASIVLDHYGLLGVPIHPFDWVRALGVLLLIAGVMLIRFG
jgi:transporter family-2 protein